MRIRIAARQSDLAKLQARSVGHALAEAYPLWRKKNQVANFSPLQIEYQFRESLGDLNQQDPLWKMPEKGVFTEDFLLDLRERRCEMVVHSWKDLPTEARSFTEIVATLQREDVRDVLLFRRDRRQLKKSKVTILTSSPRRIYNLEKFLQVALPWNVSDVAFESVRGNIPTRMRKLISGDQDGLILAKAALDRLLSSEDPDFLGSQKQMREVLAECEFMVLPVSVNPTAAAQGALAIEIHREADTDLKQLCAFINHPDVFADVQFERQTLASYGGGCHQKIGINRFSLLKAEGSSFQVTSLQGLTDQGQKLDRFDLVLVEQVRGSIAGQGHGLSGDANRGASSAAGQAHDASGDVNRRARAAAAAAAVDLSKIFPHDPEHENFFERAPLSSAERQAAEAMISQAEGIWVARDTAWLEPADRRSDDGALSGNVADGLPDKLSGKLSGKLVWTSGLKTWAKLARKGVWVHGSSEGLGESNQPRIEVLRTGSRVVSNKGIRWLKLSHSKGVRAPDMDFCATYHLHPKPRRNSPDLSDRTHFFWMSGSAFDHAFELYPEVLLRGIHACGPGHSFDHIQQKLNHAMKSDVHWADYVRKNGLAPQLQIALNYFAWRDQLAKQTS